MNDVKILYCKDQNDNIIFYRNTNRGNRYYCIDCGKELGVKHGKIKQKHLFHICSNGCLSAGESFIHKHFKNFFVPGMQIETKSGIAEIYNVLPEVKLSDRYNKTWDREIIVDVILETNLGDVIIEIWYSNKKNWIELMPYYYEIKPCICDAFEVKVDICCNTQIKWSNVFDILRNIELEIKRAEEREIENKKRLLQISKDISYPKHKKVLFFYNILQPNIIHVSDKKFQIKGIVKMPDYMGKIYKICTLSFNTESTDMSKIMYKKQFYDYYNGDDDNIMLRCICVIVKYIDSVDGQDSLMKVHEIVSGYEKRYDYTAYHKYRGMTLQSNIAHSKYKKYLPLIKQYC